MSSSKEISQFHEVEGVSRHSYLKNMILLGKVAAIFGQPRPDFANSTWFAEKEIASQDDKRKGYKIYLAFLLNPHPVLRIQNHDFPMLVLNQRGQWGAPNFYIDLIEINLKPDGLTKLTVSSYPENEREYQEALLYPDPPELTDKVEGITERKQSKFVSDSFVTYSAYPDAMPTQAVELMNRVTNDAIIDFANNPSLSPRITE